jgi:hypothetical protein
MPRRRTKKATSISRINLLRLEDIWHPHIGAPTGNRNAYKHGAYTARSHALRKFVESVIQPVRETLRLLEAIPNTSRTRR